MSIDKLEPFLGDGFMDDRVIMCDTHIWTETDLESYVRNYYVHRQVRAISRSNPDQIWN